MLHRNLSWYRVRHGAPKITCCSSSVSSSSSSRSSSSSSSRQFAWVFNSRHNLHRQITSSSHISSSMTAVACSQSAAARRQHSAVMWAGKQQQSESTPASLEQQHAADVWEEGEEDEDEGEYDDPGHVWDEDDNEEEYEDEEEDEEEQQPVSKVLQIPMGQQSVACTPDDFVEVGVISRAHGIKGEVKVQLITDEPKKRLGTAGRRLWLQPGSGRSSTAAGSSSSGQMLQRVVVQSGRVARPASKDRRAEWAVKFKEVPSRDEAELLSGSKLLLALCDRESSPRGRDEFFITDLVGLKALHQDTRELLGVVTEVYDSTGSYSLLRIRLAPNELDIQQSRYRSMLVPFVEGMVPTVDVTAGQLLLSLPEGLLETASTRKLRRPYTAEQQAQLRQQLLQRQQQQQQQQQQQDGLAAETNLQ